MILNYILARLQEGSTYSGLAVALGLVGIHTNDAVFQAVTHTLASIAAAAAVIIAEKAKGNTLIVHSGTTSVPVTPTANASTPAVPPQNP